MVKARSRGKNRTKMKKTHLVRPVKALDMVETIKQQM
jgi:hypothetical protein